MSAAAVISAIKAVIAIVKVVRRIHDLHADNATSTITLNDFNHIVTGSNAQFFADIAISDIRMIDGRFRNVWLPTVLGYARRGREIHPEDLHNPTGALWPTFSGLEVASRDLDINLNRLRVVFERYHSRLHIDELVRGFFACLNGYGLLLHMHAVRTELRRIQMRATTFDDHRLVDYTRFALQYLFDGIALLDGFPEPIWNRRRDLIGPLRELWNPMAGGSLWTFDDNYTPLRSTTPDITLTFSRFTPGDTDRHRAERARHEYIGRALDRVNAVVRSRLSEIRPHLMGLWHEMRERERRQTGTRAVIRRRVLPPRGFRRVMFAFTNRDEEEVADGHAHLEEENEDFRTLLSERLEGDEVASFLAAPHSEGQIEANSLDDEAYAPQTTPEGIIYTESTKAIYETEPPVFGVDHDMIISWPGYSATAQRVGVAY